MILARFELGDAWPLWAIAFVLFLIHHLKESK